MNILNMGYDKLSGIKHPTHPDAFRLLLILSDYYDNPFLGKLVFGIDGSTEGIETVERHGKGVTLAIMGDELYVAVNT